MEQKKYDIKKIIQEAESILYEPYQDVRTSPKWSYSKITRARDWFGNSPIFQNIIATYLRIKK